MKLSSINEWLTLIANVGVLAGIVFLAIELQQNSRIAQADSYREIVQDIAEWRSELNADPGLLALFQSYTRGGLSDMDAKDRLRVVFIENNIFGSYESAFYSREFGIISGMEWQRFEYGACNHFGYATRNDLSLTLITEEFNEYLKSVCTSSTQN